MKLEIVRKQKDNQYDLVRVLNQFWFTAARILSPSLNFGIRGGYRGCQLVEEYKTFVCLEKYLNA